MQTLGWLTRSVEVCLFVRRSFNTHSEAAGNPNSYSLLYTGKHYSSIKLRRLQNMSTVSEDWKKNISDVLNWCLLGCTPSRSRGNLKKYFNKINYIQ